MTALYAQDSCSIKSLTVTGGLRWETLEGYLPEQGARPAGSSRVCRARSPSSATSSSWNTIGPRISGAYDLLGSGRTALKASAGRYYYVIASGGGMLDTA